MTKHTLYQITDQNDKIIYVGISKNFKQRKYYHDYATRTPDKQVWSKSKNAYTWPHRTYLYNKLRKIKNDEPNFDLEQHIHIISEYNTYQELLLAEIAKIKEYQEAGILLCNLTSGGEGAPGVKKIFTKEWKQKLSDAKRKHFDNGGKNSFAGKKHSTATIEKIVETRKNNIASGKIEDYNKLRIGKTNVELYGQKRANEISSKLSQSKAGISLPHTKEWETNRVKALKGITKNGTKYRISNKTESFVWHQSLYTFAESIGQKGDKFYTAMKRGTPTKDGWSVEKIIDN
jgi:hypothetical protein